jgi:hypothetical protein
LLSNIAANSSADASSILASNTIYKSILGDKGIHARDHETRKEALFVLSNIFSWNEQVIVPNNIDLIKTDPSIIFHLVQQL